MHDQEEREVVEHCRHDRGADDLVRFSVGLGEDLGVLDVVGGARDGRYAVLRRLSSKDGGARYLVLSTSGRVSTLGYKQITDLSRRVGSIELPTPFKPRDRRFVQQAVKRLRKVPTLQSQGASSTRADAHPVAECPDASRHLAALRKSDRLSRRLDQHTSARRSSGHGLVAEFRSIHSLLEQLGYVDEWSLTSRGQRLRRIYNESDLLLTESVEWGAFQGLRPEELAALASAFVFEPRSENVSAAEWPTTALDQRWAQVEEIWSSLAAQEKGHALVPTRRPDPGFAVLTYLWATGTGFDELPTRGMAPGDFVRVSRQLVDLLRQIRDAVEELHESAGAALRAIDRGVVAAQGVG